MKEIHQVYKCEPPNGDEPFYAATIVGDDNRLSVISTRNGKWEPETILHQADLSMPEQEFNEWEIYPVDSSEARPSLEMDARTKQGPANSLIPAAVENTALAPVHPGERWTLRDSDDLPQEGFARRLLFKACDDALKHGIRSGPVVNGKPLSPEEMREMVAYARSYGFLQ